MDSILMHCMDYALTMIELFYLESREPVLWDKEACGRFPQK